MEHVYYRTLTVGATRELVSVWKKTQKTEQAEDRKTKDER